jgi:uncharacterized phage infection (PIP) family protein YhgE
MEEELLKQILGEIKNLKDGMQNLNSGQQQITQRLDRVEDGQQQLKTELTTIKSDMASERQQIEISSIVHALRHNSEEVNAQLHNLGHNFAVLTGKAATKEDVPDLSAQLRVLHDRLFRQEVEVDKLKAVK